MQNRVSTGYFESCNIDTFSYFGLLLNLDFSHWVKWESEKKKMKREMTFCMNPSFLIEEV